jgi:hypothetical protein
VKVFFAIILIRHLNMDGGSIYFVSDPICNHLRRCGQYLAVLLGVVGMELEVNIRLQHGAVRQGGCYQSTGVYK